MNISAQAVTESVAKILGKALFVEDTSRQGINVSAWNAGLHEVDALNVSFQNLFVDFDVARRGFSDHDGSGQVGAVAVKFGSKVHRDEVAVFEFAFGCGAMRSGAVRSANGDRWKGVLRATSTDVELDFQHQIPFADSGLDHSEDVLVASVSESASPLDQGDLFGRFHHSDGFDNPLDRNKFDSTERLLPILKNGHCDDCGFDAQTFDSEA